MRRTVFTAFAAVAGWLITSSAYATPLPVGSSTTTPGTISNPLTDPNDTILATKTGSGSATLNGATLNYTYSLYVVRIGAGGPLANTSGGMQTAGDLDFVYQVNNLSSSTTVVESTSHFNFSTTMTGGVGVDYVAGSGNVNPGLATRSGTTTHGATVKFNFLGNGDINPGQSSTLNVIETLSRNYTVGNYTLQDGVTANITAYAPGPEPSSMVLVGLGAMGLIGYGLRRRKAMGA
jgi:hypothetical protein